MNTTMRLSLIQALTASAVLFTFYGPFYCLMDQKLQRSLGSVSEIRYRTSDSFFHQASRVAYQYAIQLPNSTLPRRKFDLASWQQKTSGGLKDDDRQLLGELYYHADSVFEFGLGESTYIAAATGVPRYAGVDSDPEWVAIARKNARMDHFRFYFADIGNTKEWGKFELLDSPSRVLCRQNV